ncbi:MAG TPA: hypothetical protein VEU33_37140 [Archangium sp.]|nr:hypothetical protein [Archangium sp.]
MGTWAEEMIERGVQKSLTRETLPRLRGHILRLLSTRGMQVDDAARQRILSCSDLDTLDRWFDRALNATTLSDVLDDLSQ